MKFRMGTLRKIIRGILVEAVLGDYSRDPQEKPPPWAPGSSSDDEEYIDDGSVSEPAQKGDPSSQRATASSVRTLTQQRQKQLNKGDAVSADETGRQLGAVRKTRG